MNKSRNWQEDKTLCEEMLMNNLKAQRAVLAETPEMPLYWLQQYAAAETREKKLREAIEDRIRGCITIADYNHADALKKLLASLYPEEETPQIKRLNDKDMQASQAFIDRHMKEEEAK